MMQHDMFGDNWTVVFTEDELRIFHRPIEPGPWGGNQRLAHEFQLREAYGTLEATGTELCSAYKKAWAYGDGTWQNYFRMVERAARRAGWKPSAAFTEDVMRARAEVLSRRYRGNGNDEDREE